MTTDLVLTRRQYKMQYKMHDSPSWRIMSHTYVYTCIMPWYGNESVSNMNESCLTYEWVLSHISRSLARQCVMPHIWFHNKDHQTNPHEPKTTKLILIMHVLSSWSGVWNHVATATLLWIWQLPAGAPRTCTSRRARLPKNLWNVARGLADPLSNVESARPNTLLLFHSC